MRLWREGAVDAIVTGPGHKQALHAGGYNVPGHTELLADAAGVPRLVRQQRDDDLRLFDRCALFEKRADREAGFFIIELR